MPSEEKETTASGSGRDKSMSNYSSWRNMCRIAIMALLLAFGMTSDAFADGGTVISVGLESNKASYVVSSDVPFIVTDAGGKRIICKMRANDKVTVGMSKKGMTINGKTISGTKVLIHSEGKKRKGILKLNGIPYRGSFAISSIRGKMCLQAVNQVPLEEYLYGVVPNEMSPSWASEALKAQAVAARTFALHDMKKHATEGYDVCATTHCQVYRGVNSEHRATSSAVDLTAGEYLAYHGKAIISLFHAGGGGYTENSENVWGKHEPYLRGVEDFDQKSPNYQWEIKMTVGKLSSLLGNHMQKVGRLRTIKLSHLAKAPMHTSDRGISGRVCSLVLEGDKGAVTVSGTEMRSLLGLKSTLFDIDKRSFGGNANDTITIRGYGFGHGLGMSQWGAKTMAEKGGNKNGLYKKILSHYYCKAELKKI